MAVRTITTRLTLEGESEYKNKIKNINAELSMHKSALALVTSEYKDNANSLAALEAKETAIKDIQADLTAKISEHATMLEKAKQAQEKYGGEVSRLEAELKDLDASAEGAKAEEERLNKELEKAQARLQKAQNAVFLYQKQVNNTTIEQKKFDDELSKVEKYLDEARQSADGCATSIDEFGKEVKDAGKEVEGAGDAVDLLAAALASAGVKKGIQEITEALCECVDASVDFENVMADVRRTVGGSESEISALGDEFKKLSTTMKIPITASELGRIAETAGQLGIAREQVSEFTKVMGMLDKTTDLTADSAATMLAQFANITGLEDYERLGTTVAELGDATATTASKVVKMSQGLAAAASMAGFQATEILAISAAMGSLGIEAQAGSTAMSTLISTLHKAVETGSNLRKFAVVAGMSAEQFAGAWREDAAGALEAFISGLNDTERNGRSAIVTLDDLGITNVRQTKAILGLANAEDLLSNTIDQANRAWEENTALTDKANIMYETTESKFKKAEDSVNLLKIAIGDQLTPALADFAETGGGAAEWATEFLEQNRLLVPVISGLITASGILSGSVALWSAKAALSAVATKVFGAAFVDAAAKAGILNTALNALSAHPMVAVAAAIAAVVVAVGTYVAALRESEDETDKFTRSVQKNREELQEQKRAIEDNRRSYKDMADQLDKLLRKEEKSAGDKVLIAKLCEQLSEGVDGLSLSYDAESDSINTATAAIYRMIDAQAASSDYELNVLALSEAMTDQARIVSELEQKTAALAEAEEKKNQWVRDGTYWAMGAEAMSSELDDTIRGLKDDIEALTNKQSANNAQVEELTDSVNEYAEAQNEIPESTETAVDALGRIGRSLEGVTEAYNKARKAARKSIDEQIGLFDELDGTAEQSAEDLINVLGHQADYLQDYSENVRKVMEKGFDPAIIEQLTSEFSEENAKYLAALAEADASQVERMNNLYGEVQRRKDKVADALGDAQTGFSKAVDGLHQDLGNVLNAPSVYNAAYSGGQQTAQGIIDGIKSKQDDAVAAAEEMARQVQYAYNRVMDQHSPSRVMAQSGRFTVEGLIQGFDDSEAALIKRVEELGARVSQAMAVPIPEEPNTFSQTAAQAASVAGSLITVSKAEEMNESPAQPTMLDLSIELGGNRVARALYDLNLREARRRGKSLVEGETG